MLRYPPANVRWRPDSGANGRWQYEIIESCMRRTGWLDLPVTATDEQLRETIRFYEPGFDGPIIRFTEDGRYMLMPYSITPIAVFCAECNHVMTGPSRFCGACRANTGRMLVRLYAMLGENEEIQIVREINVPGNPVGVNIEGPCDPGRPGLGRDSIAGKTGATLAEALARTCNELERAGRTPRR